MKRKLSLFFVFIVMISLCLSMVSCGDKENNARALNAASSLVDALVDGDFNQVYEEMKYAGNREELAYIYDQVGPYFEGITTYELKQTGWYSSWENGISYYRATFEMTSNRPEVLQIEITVETESEKTVGFYIKGLSTGEDSPPSILLQIACYGLTALVIVFCVWMIVDCIRREVKRPWLWIIIILLGAMFTLSYQDGSASFNWMVGFCFFPSVFNVGWEAFLVRITVPVGAIVYFALRKNLTKEEKNVERSVIKKTDDANEEGSNQIS